MMGQVPDTGNRNISKREELLKTNLTSIFCQGLEWTGSYEFFKPFLKNTRILFNTKLHIGILNLLWD